MPLGRTAYLSAFAFKGAVDTITCETVTARVAEKLNLDIHNLEPHSWHFPTLNGNGDGEIGFTYVQPCTASAFIWDVWPEHVGGYFIALLCVDHDPGTICEVLETAGLEVVDLDGSCLTLTNGISRMMEKLK